LLLKLLALEPGRRVHRERAMELLWPEQDPAAASNNLYKMIHAARRALEPGLAAGAASLFIATGGHQITLHAPGGGVIDAAEFQSRAASALKGGNAEDYESALALYEQDLLPEDPYVDWIEMRREQLRTLFRDLAVGLSKIYEDAGRYREGIFWLKEWLQKEVTDEEAHRRVMKLHLLAGERHLALNQYRVCKESLLREVGVAPERQTESLRDAIENGGSVTPPPPPAARPHRLSIRQLTFRTGRVEAARFVRDTRAVVFSAFWEGEPSEVYALGEGEAAARSLGLRGAGISSATKAGDLAV
jgi:DNA-binding SARP family transcriptional activator